MSKQLLILSLLFLFLMESSLQYFNIKKLKHLDLFVYYVPVKEVILCTNKQIPEDKLELNEIQTKEGFVCLVPVEDEDVINVNIHMTKTKGEEKTVNESGSRLVNLDIGESRVLSEIDLYDEYYANNPYEKNVLIKTKTGEINFSIENPRCLQQSEQNCYFRSSGEKIFLNQFLKLTFKLAQQKPSVFSFIEKTIIPNVCEPPCVNGVCYNEKCLCEQDFMGTDCSVAMKANGKKKSILFAILVLLLSIVLAILFSLSFFCLCVFVFAPKAEYRDLEMHEEWNKEG